MGRGLLSPRTGNTGFFHCTRRSFVVSPGYSGSLARPYTVLFSVARNLSGTVGVSRMLANDGSDRDARPCVVTANAMGKCSVGLCLRARGAKVARFRAIAASTATGVCTSTLGVRDARRRCGFDFLLGRSTARMTVRFADKSGILGSCDTNTLSGKGGRISVTGARVPLNGSVR